MEFNCEGRLFDLFDPPKSPISTRFDSCKVSDLAQIVKNFDDLKVWQYCPLQSFCDENKIIRETWWTINLPLTGYGYFKRGQRNKLFKGETYAGKLASVLAFGLKSNNLN